jgi:hypothetical protein
MFFPEHFSSDALILTPHSVHLSEEAIEQWRDITWPVTPPNHAPVAVGWPTP